MLEDLKNFVAPPPLWPQVLFAVVMRGLAVAAMVIQDNAERQTELNLAEPYVPKSDSAGRVSGKSAVAAPYLPCKKLRDGKWLRSEIAHWRKDGWEVFCEYDGMKLMTREELKL